MTLPPQFNNQQLSDEHCFLCGNDAQKMSDEHVIPTWLQHKYDLWDKRLTLLNESSIPYRRLKVPCCVPCNNQALSSLEGTISNAVKEGYTSASALDKELWFYWAAKLAYGLWRKELGLLFNQRDSSQGTILTEEQLKSFDDLHLFLQGISGKHRFVDEVPYSVLVCNLHDLGEEQGYFYKDNLAYQTSSIRMGEVGVIVCFSDDGLSESSYGEFLGVVNGRKLHPLQFDELYARVNYQISLMDKNSSYVTTLDTTTGMKETNTTGGSYYLRDWNQADFYEVLKREISRWFSDENAIQFVPPSSVTTFLFKGDGKTPYIKIKSEWFHSDLE